MKIYHNPRCSKSRQTLAILESKTTNFEIINYIKHPLTYKEIELILIKLKISPIELVRKTGKIWKENYKTKNMTDNEIITIMIENPKLIQRPIIVTNEKAIIGRPPENILKLFN